MDVTCVMICSPFFCDGKVFISLGPRSRVHISPSKNKVFYSFFFPAGSFITDYLCPFVHPLFMASGSKSQAAKREREREREDLIMTCQSVRYRVCRHGRAQ